MRYSPPDFFVMHSQFSPMLTTGIFRGKICRVVKLIHRKLSRNRVGVRSASLLLASVKTAYQNGEVLFHRVLFQHIKYSI